MEKTITTGTEITFKKTNDKFELILIPTGFEVKRIKLSKSIPTEPYTFQELLDEYERGRITIDGFEEADAPLVRSILTNYIHTHQIETLKADINQIVAEKDALENSNKELTAANQGLTTSNQELTTANSELSTANGELTHANKELTDFNDLLKKENEGLKSEKEQLVADKNNLLKKVEELNTALAAMAE